ncbi:MAG: RNA methyltransferase [Nitrosomonadales bacterium]|nr:RNA methyltransferase [Nitrosomonadales bacterium]MBT7407748.1 RNA methyltransferase [Nitrosomonadales bacterium]
MKKNKLMLNKIIDSKHNTSYKYFKKIATKKNFRKEKNKTILIGPHIIKTFLDAKKDIHCFIRDESKNSLEIEEIIKLHPDVVIYYLKNGLFCELSDLKSSNGLIAIVNVPIETDSAIKKGLNLFIDGIQDPGNLGSILRTAEAAGINAVYLSKKSAELWSPKTLRGSQGAQVNLKCYEGQDLVALCDQVSIPIYSLSICGESIYDDDLPRNLVLILGSEGGGINADLISKSTKSISIPMKGFVESLNVGAAAGIFIYEHFRKFQLNVKP